MSSFAATLVRADPVDAAPAEWPRLGRIAAAATLVLGATFQVMAFATIPSHDDTSDRLQWVANHESQAQVSKVFDELAIPFLVGAAIVYLLLSRRRAPRLAWTGGLLLVMGMVGLAMVQGAEMIAFGLAPEGLVEPTRLGDAIDDLSTPSLIVMFLMFLPGALFGVLISGLALWRSRAVPRGVVLLLYAFLVTDIALEQGLAAHVIALVAAVWIATTILRARSAAPE